MPAAGLALAIRLADLVRGGRTLLLLALSPAEGALRRLAGRGPLPPLWLRRHVGPLARFESAARETAAMLDRLELVRPGDLVVDLGCGCGSMAEALGERVGEGGRYLGVDVHEPSIRWCRRRWEADPRFAFEVAAVASPYAAGGAGVPCSPRRGSDGAAGASPPLAETYRLTLPDGAAGFVLAKSLFTHLLEPEARAYLAEIRRVLAPGRRALATAFLFAGGEVEPPAFPHPRPAAGAPVRWRRAVRPHAAVAYDRTRFEELIAEAGLAVAAFVPGFWPGTHRPPGGQDLLVLERPADPQSTASFPRPRR